ncbi:MAG: hypothetical protein ACI9XO_004062 [Paraglaciecola sp.]|jgi:hypothetical protein
MQFFKTNLKLKELDLSFFKNRKSVWIDENQAAKVQHYLRIETPIFNASNTLCYLNAYFICNRVDECGGSITAIYQKKMKYGIKFTYQSWNLKFNYS